MQTILFVCTGNTCRSAMAEAIFRHMLENRADRENEFKKDIKIMSAGTYAWGNDEASPGAVEIMKEKDIDIKGHRSRLLTPKLIGKADLILTMTLNHKGTVLNMCPGAEGKVYTLKEYVLGDKDKKLHTPSICYGEANCDIRDPYGQSVEVYRRSAEEIEIHLKMLIDRI